MRTCRGRWLTAGIFCGRSLRLYLERGIQRMFATLLVLLAAAVLYLWIKIRIIYRTIEELSAQIQERLETDTNVGIDISSGDRKLRAFVSVLDRQLTELRKKQIQYTRGDQELKMAVTNVSHDLRTPLTAIYGYLDLVRQEPMSAAAAEYLGVIKNRADALKALSEELFRYSVILSVDAYQEREDVCLQSVLEESIAAYYAAIVKAGISPEIHMAGKAVVRRLNRQALARIFSNIINNAIKYSGGDFYVDLDQDGGIHFSNYAPKMDPVIVGHLFDRFYTVTTGSHSTGLGLSIARALTEELEGRIEAEYRKERLYIHVCFPADSRKPNEKGKETDDGKG